MKPVPKSLHTVTVLVAIAKTTGHYLDWYRDSYNGYAPFAREQLANSVDCAMKILSLAECPDTYGLREQAIRKLSKGV